MNHVLRFVYAALLLLLCPALAQGAGADQPVLPPTLDEQFIALAEQAPGFGGLYQDPLTGSVIVRVQDLRQAPAARKVVGAFLTGRQPLAGATAGIPRTTSQVPDMRFIKADYDFRDLARWRRQLEKFALDVLTRSDIDEVANRVQIGVIDEAAAHRIAGALKDLGIPSGALTVQVIPPAVADNLRGAARPVRGGLQVKALPGPAGTGNECTLGYVALREYPGPLYDFGGPRYVVTCSHCTTDFAALDTDDVIGQPTQAERIGIEFSDPPFRNNASDPACPTSAQMCRRSDAALFLLDDNSSSTSTFNGVATASGLTLTGTVFYAGRQQGFRTNQRVAKIGRTTGLTSGLITATCVNEFFNFPDRHMVCQMEATYSSQPGDSGSPVWYTDLSGNRFITGIHVGRNNALNRAIFSFWLDAYVEISNDVLARTGQQWSPAFTTGPVNFSTN